jgi:hypothetical protein
MLKLQKKINPYETIEDAMVFIAMLENVIGYDIEKVVVDKEIIYQLDIHFQIEDSAQIAIPAVIAHTVAAHEMIRLIMHTLGWRKEEQS